SSFVLTPRPVVCTRTCIGAADFSHHLRAGQEHHDGRERRMSINRRPLTNAYRARRNRTATAFAAWWTRCTLLCTSCSRSAVPDPGVTHERSGVCPPIARGLAGRAAQQAPAPAPPTRLSQ